ncbi:NACHT domain-containing protein [Streptomyces alboflavus]|uniref:NACHT domain-containing protein n=1 Tax=Streptomyces alboflavus TaxID=67267 RepID=UPI000F6572E2|nr:hypothetical protein [Streptomyces alboflavus]
MDKNKVYELVRGTVLLSLESTKGLATRLKRDPSEVEPVWLRAREAMDLRMMADEEERKPRVSTWAEIPKPQLALRNVLDALKSVTDQLPYRLLGINPPQLSTVYVRQRLREGPPTQTHEGAKERDISEVRIEPGDKTSLEVPVTIADALNRSEHLLVTGEPGSGKSTLGHHLISRLARIWLREDSASDPPLNEPVLPLRVSARALAGGGSWSTVLTEATRRALGMYLVTEPTQQLFTGRTHGARWLIVVDGLDEILDRPTRTSVIRALGQHARAGSEYRFVIISRPLPDDELTPLRGTHIGRCRIEPFEPEELKLFAERWFLSQDPITAERRASEFLGQVSDGRLKDLVRNPLLASIAAVANTREPDRPLPANRVDLYQRFYEYLVTDEEASGRATPQELQRLQQGQPGRFRLAEWIHHRRVSVIDAMAVARMDTDLSLMDVACIWVRENRPPDMELSPDWERDFQRLLIDTGVFVYESSGIRFLHHTLAEFIAARHHAISIPSDFPNRGDWFERGLLEAGRNFVLLTLASWGRIDGNDIDLVFRALLSENMEHNLLAGRLLAEIGEIETECSRLVVDRLIDIALGNCRHGFTNHTFARYPESIRIRTRLFPAESAFEVIELLNGNEYAASRLWQIVNDQGIPLLTRLMSLGSLSDIAAKEEVTQALRSLSPSLSQPFERAVVASGLTALSEDEFPEDARRILRELAEDPQTDPEALALAAEALSEKGEMAAAIVAARAALTRTDTANVDLRTAAKILITCGSETINSEDVLRLASEMSPSRAIEIAKELLNAGHLGEAKEAAKKILKDPGVPRNVIARVIEITLKDASPQDAEALLEELKKRPSWLRERPFALGAILEGGCVLAVSELAGEILQDAHATAIETEAAAKAWLAVGDSPDANGLINLLGQRPNFDAWTRSNVASMLADVGFLAEAAELMLPIFSDPTADIYDTKVATRVIRQTDPAVQQDVVSSAMEFSSTVEQRVRLVQVLSSLSERQRVEKLALQLLGDPKIIHEQFKITLETLLATSGFSVVDRTMETLMHSRVRPSYLFSAAEQLASAGALPHAVKIWSDLISTPRRSPLDSFTALSCLINTGHREHAINALRASLGKRTQNVHDAAQIRGLLGWAIFSDPSSCETCNQLLIRGCDHP